MQKEEEKAAPYNARQWPVEKTGSYGRSRAIIQMQLQIRNQSNRRCRDSHVPIRNSHVPSGFPWGSPRIHLGFNIQNRRLSPRIHQKNIPRGPKLIIITDTEEFIAVKHTNKQSKKTNFSLLLCLSPSCNGDHRSQAPFLVK